MRDIRPIQRLSIIQYRLIQDHIPRASRTLPRHPVIRVKRPAEATKDCKNRKTDHRSEYPKPNVPLWTPNIRPLSYVQPQPHKDHHQNTRTQKPRPQRILLHCRIKDRPLVILHAIEQHDIEPLMKNLIIRNARHKEERHQRNFDTPQHLSDTCHRPLRVKRIRDRSEKKRERHQERRRLETDPRPQPERGQNIPHSGAPHLPRVNRKKCDAEKHEKKIDIKKQLRVLLNGF